jgi:hypothetical protein
MPKFRGEHIEDKEHKIRVSEVHFLIHPGFIGDEDDTDRGYKRPLSEREEKVYKTVSKRYKKAADEISPNALMIAFLHKKRSSNALKRDLEEQNYLEAVKYLEGKLGPRLIILSGDFHLSDDDEGRTKEQSLQEAKRAWQAALRIAEARGFTFDASVLTKAYGEFVTACLPDSAVNLNRANRLASKTLIETKYTDMGLPGQVKKKGVESYAEELKERGDDEVEYKI